MAGAQKRRDERHLLADAIAHGDEVDHGFRPADLDEVNLEHRQSIGEPFADRL